MIVSDPDRIVTKQDLRDFYNAISPYLVKLPQSVKIVPFATGTDEEIADMLAAHYAGAIDIRNYWEIGDQRIVRIAACGGISYWESHAAQNIRLVIMHKGGIELTTPEGSRTECAFVVGMRDILHVGGQVEDGPLQGSGTTTRWSACGRRSWCNSTFRNAIPASLRSMFKQFKNPTHDGSTALTVNDYFSLPSVTELWGPWSGIPSEGFQFDYYKTASNRAKYNYTSSSPFSTIYWTRTFQNNSYHAYYRRNDTDIPTNNACYTEYSLSMFGVL